jgi:hypothetical protein
VSNVKAMADREAVRAETESPEPGEPEPGEPGEPGEPEPGEPGEPEPIGQGDGRSMDKVHRDVESEMRRHEKAFAKAVGIDPSELNVCKTCGGAGFVPEPMDEPREYATRSDLQPCDECNALGMMQTGSRVPGNDLLPCPVCSGAGYRQKSAPAAAVANGQQQPSPAPADPTIQALRDQGYTIIEPIRVGT